MVLEVEAYVGRRKKPTKFPLLNPGESMHILNVDFEGKDEIWIVQCKIDDSLSTVHKIIPEQIYPNVLNPHVAEFDKSKSENRAKVIRRGQEWDLYVRQRTQEPHRFTHGRYHFKHT